MDVEPRPLQPGAKPSDLPSWEPEPPPELRGREEPSVARRGGAAAVVQEWALGRRVGAAKDHGEVEHLRPVGLADEPPPAVLGATPEAAARARGPPRSRAVGPGRARRCGAGPREEARGDGEGKDASRHGYLRMISGTMFFPTPFWNWISWPSTVTPTARMAGGKPPGGGVTGRNFRCVGPPLVVKRPSATLCRVPTFTTKVSILCPGSKSRAATNTKITGILRLTTTGARRSVTGERRRPAREAAPARPFPSC